MKLCREVEAPLAVEIKSISPTPITIHSLDLVIVENECMRLVSNDRVQIETQLEEKSSVGAEFILLPL